MSSTLLCAPAQALPRPHRAHVQTFYVGPATTARTGQLSSHAINECTVSAQPCTTISQAIAQAAAFTRGSAQKAVVSLARGVYDNPGDTMFRDLSPANDNLTITGAGRQTRVAPSSCAALSTAATGPDASSSESAIVDLDALHGITVENMTIYGGGLRNAGCGSAGYRAAVLATGGSSANSIDNVIISSGTQYGIQMDDGSQTTLDDDALQPTLCSVTMKGPKAGLGAGWTYSKILKVSKTPSCASGFTSVDINGVSYSAIRKGSKGIEITGGPKPPATPAIPNGSSLVFNTTVAAYTSVGIACNTLTEPAPAPTSCSVSSTTVSGGGTVYTSAGSPVGILVTNGATGNLDGNKVAGNTDSTGNGIGIGLLPDTTDGETAGPTTVGFNESTESGTGCTAVGNDISILASAFPSVASSVSWGINDNTISGIDAGVLLSGLATGTNVGSVALSGNTVTNTLLGPGIELADDSGVGGALTVGGDIAALGNSITANGIGIAVTEGTSQVMFENNSITSNLSFGVAVDGPDAMPEFLPGASTADNEFVDNSWSANGTPVSGVMNGGANVIDFGGFQFPSSSQSVGGSAAAQATDLVLADPVSAGTTPTSITLTKTSGSVELGPGTLISISGYCAASTFTCNGTNVSFFVTGVGSSVTGNVGSTPVVVDVAPIAPSVAQAVRTVPAGVSVASNDQVPLTSSNSYGSGNSCTPVAPNSSATLKAGTGGGPSGQDGSTTGYEAC